MSVRRAGLVAATLAVLSGTARADGPPPGAESCAGCHGPAERPSSMPSLAGLSAPYIAAQMRLFRENGRPATLMDRIARGFTDEEAAAIAAWIAGGGR